MSKLGSSGQPSGLGAAQAARRYAHMRDGKLVDTHLRDQLVQHDMDFRALGLTHFRSFEERIHGVGDNHIPLIMKYLGTEEEKRKTELRVALMGHKGLGWEGEGFSEDELQATRGMLFSKALTIAGGTSEVQLNIIAKRVLGLPD
jgi:alkylation response protein AidB-like acyl-CoA dehydrogenase